MTSASRVPTCALSHSSLLCPSLFFRWGSQKRYSETLVQGCLLWKYNSCNLVICTLSKYTFLHFLGMIQAFKGDEGDMRWNGPTAGPIGRLLYWRAGLRGVELVISYLTCPEIWAGMHCADNKAQIFTLQVRQLRPREVKRPAESHWAGWIQDWLTIGELL